MQHIFVGDVQGCGDEFAELVDRARREFGRSFELWVVGDLINRGPDNLGPLRLLRELVEAGRARFVLGNHEISLLRCWLGLRPLGEFDSFQDVLEARDAHEWIDWLRHRPLVETGRLGDTPFAMVHASVHPEWSLEDLEENARSVERHLGKSLDRLGALLGSEFTPQEDLLGRMTRCRSVDAHGGWSAEEPVAGATRPWHAAWSEARHRYGVVYGHWSMQGLHVAPNLRGLDTGCVHHGRGRDGALTAWLPDPKGRHVFGLPDERFWSIPARRMYYGHRDG